MAKGKVMVLDNYSKPNSKSVQQIVDNVTQAGFDYEIVRYSDAKAAVGKGDNLVEGYHAVVSSGSGKAWKKSGTQSNGKEVMKTSDPVHENIVNSDTPFYGICGGAHYAAQALGYQVENTGQFNRGKDKKGRHFNHKYGINADNLDKRVENVETIDHADGKYVAKMDIGNKRLVQYHPEKAGGDEIVDFLNQYASQKYRKAA